MIDIQCPNCNAVLNVQHNRVAVVCKKCLVDTGKKFIMVESETNPKYRNLGDGFFEKLKE